MAASISTRVEDQGRHVISFQFDRTQSTTITTDALWCFAACDLVCQYPSLHQHLVEGSREHSSSDVDHLFKSLIETPLLSLDDIPHEELPVTVMDGLDECGGLRHDSSGWDDYEGLLRTLKRWVQVDHLKKFKLVITSMPENRITPSPIPSVPMSISPLAVMLNREVVLPMTSGYSSSHDSM